MFSSTRITCFAKPALVGSLGADFPLAKCSLFLAGQLARDSSKSKGSELGQLVWSNGEISCARRDCERLGSEEERERESNQMKPKVKVEVSLNVNVNVK